MHARPLVVVAEPGRRQHVVEGGEGLLEAAEIEEHGRPLAARPETPWCPGQHAIEQLERALRLFTLAREHRLPLHEVDRLREAAATAQHLAAKRRRVPLPIELLDAIEEPLQDLLVAHAHDPTPSARRSRAVISTGVKGMRGP